MKKTLMIICVALVVALMCTALIACDNNTPPNNDGDNGHNSYEQAKYTVTFNTNGSDVKLTDYIVRDVVSGSSVEAPKNRDGSEYVPFKTGYTFQYWSAGNDERFIFGQTPIVKNTTITAIYTNNTYKLTPELNKKLVATLESDGKYKYTVEDYTTGLTIGQTEDIKATYDAADSILIPDDVPENDEFMFWFYLDDEGKPVQLTKFKEKANDNTVKFANKWLLLKGVTIYPMLKSMLPKVEVKYVDSDSEAQYFAASYPVSESISVDESENAQSYASKTGYRFAKWYYKQTIEEDGEEKVVDKDFVFKDDNTTGTTLYSACGLEDYFTPATLKLYAKWIEIIDISSVEDFERVYNLLRSEDAKDEKKIANILEADITISAVLDFGSKAFEPLFDKDHVFIGTIDGASYDDNKQITSRAKIVGGVFGAYSHASVFGYVSGTIENLVFDNVGLTVKTDDDGKYGNNVYVAYVASVLGGKIENCTVTVTQTPLVLGKNFDTLTEWREKGMKAVCFGSIAAEVNGDSRVKNTGMITNCTAVVSASFICESLTFGGVCGTNNSSSVLSSNKADVTLAQVLCRDDMQSSNGRPFAKIGGITARNGGAISKSESVVKVQNFTCLDETYFGGVCAENTGSVITTSAQVAFKGTVGGSLSQNVCIGGIIGRNEGYITNSYCNVDIDVTAQQADGNVAVGGIVGSNVSDKTDSSSGSTGIGALNSVYVVGSIKVTATADNVELYVGGIAGRNAKEKIAKCFTVTDIEVVNKDSGKTNFGPSFGKHEKDVNFSTTTIYYADDSSFTLNGETKFEYSEDQGRHDVTSSAFKNGEVIELDDDIWEYGNGEYPKLKK